MRNDICIRVIGDYVMTIIQTPNGELVAWVSSAREVAALILTYRQALRLIQNG